MRNLVIRCLHIIGIIVAYFCLAALIYGAVQAAEAYFG